MPKPFGSVQPNDVEDEDGINNPEEKGPAQRYSIIIILFITNGIEHMSSQLSLITSVLNYLSDSSYQMSVWAN